MAGLAVTSADRPAFCPEMRKLILVAILVAATACGAYHFPDSNGGIGTVSGNVSLYPCAPVEPATQACVYDPSPACLEVPNDGQCGPQPMAAVPLTFTDGSARQNVKTALDGSYSIDLPAGTWKVSSAGILRIISGPNPVVVQAGAHITANYVIDTGIRAAS
jgi:hypothetical protein